MANEDIKQFETGVWKDMPKYACPRCNFDAVTPAIFRDHLKHCRKPKRPVVKNPIEAKSEPIAKKQVLGRPKEK